MKLDRSEHDRELKMMKAGVAPGERAKAGGVEGVPDSAPAKAGRAVRGVPKA